MKQTHKKIATYAMAALFTACSNGNKNPGQPPSITASQIQVSTILPMDAKATNISNLYYADHPGNYTLYWLSGILTTNTNIDQIATLKFINVPVAGSILAGVIDEQRPSITVTSSELIESAAARGVWVARDFSKDQPVIASWKKAFVAESSINPATFTTNFYAVAESAVAGIIDTQNNYRGVGFVSLVPATESTALESLTLVSGFQSNCALSSNDIVTSLNTTTHLDDGVNNNYVEVGTLDGNVCIYGIPGSEHAGWNSLFDSSTKANAYKTGSPVEVIQILPHIDQDYAYWSNLNGTIWRAISHKKSTAHVVEQLNNPAFINSPLPQNINPETLVIDNFNNVYIGGKAIRNQLTKVYVLPANTKTWRVVQLPNELNDVTAISFAALNHRPVVSTTHKAYYLDNIPH